MAAGTRSVMLVGATGLVGGECLRRLQRDPSVRRIVVLARRPLVDAPSKAEIHVVDFDHLDDHAALFEVDQVMCALGTTIKTAGSRDAFRRVDFDYAFETARLGAERGARHFLLVSAIGAKAASRVFYLRVKGELEDAVRRLSYRSITIVRPSLLLGERRESRVGESIAKRVGFLFPPASRPVPAHRVALALVDAARTDAPGMHIIESVELRRHQ